MAKKKVIWLSGSLFCLLLMGILGGLRLYFNPQTRNRTEGTYTELAADMGTEDPLAHISEDFLVAEGFSTNLPIVLLEIEGELSDYKSFHDGEELVDETAEPYQAGTISILDGGNGKNCLTDTPTVISSIRIKKRGHTSFTFDKAQYLIKTVDGELDNEIDVMGMGEGHSWILNGSLADKSMLRNYLAYRIASEAGGGAMAPDSRYCEVILKTDAGYEYQGVYLFLEAVARGVDRVNIDEFKKKNVYTSYIVRRDRFTNFDVMLDTYGRQNGLSEEWIGVKYPSEARLTEAAKRYIEEDFSRIEQVIYADEEELFKTYDKYIDTDSFVDYFLINEFFGNYDAGNHSTYMYKNSGGKLYIGPVWDFDQAMNNYFADDMDAEVLAFQEKPFYEKLCRDERFIDRVKARYAVLRKSVLSEDHVFGVMEETVRYLRSAQEREWYRWAADYEDGTMENPHNYYLQDIEKDGVIISRFQDEYEQELYTIRSYLHKHGNVIQSELTKLYDLAEYDTSIKNENELLLIVVMVLFLTPALLIDRKG